ncbi:MAG TPA: gephyrin-like molybdotransferase Glp [Actinomycetota bacterium]|nr:gephyrin-like molybdotransferase Glp [Actinomycetota bacterium]
MRTVEEVRADILSAVKTLDPVTLPLLDAWGCVLVDDARAPYDIPTFASSAMDGYAVRSEDVSSVEGSGVVLKRVGSAFIGKTPDAEVGPGEAMWIATGAPVPPGADCIAPKEDVTAEPDVITVHKPFEQGQFVRPPGQDLREGDVVVPAGKILAGPELGNLSTAGFSEVTVYPKVRVCVVSTGDELVEPGSKPAYGQIPDGNGYTISGCLKELGISPVRPPIVPDDEDLLRKVFQTNAAEVDVFISSGGMSVGDLDVVRKVVSELGRIDSYKVAMQPGMPQAFGTVENRTYFGLPGNPVSVFVSFELFIRPALLKMMGRTDLARPVIDASIDDDMEGLPDRTRYSRVLVYRDNGAWRARSTGPAASNLLGTVVKGNGLAVIPAGGDSVKAGDKVKVQLYRPLEQVGPPGE